MVGNERIEIGDANPPIQTYGLGPALLLGGCARPRLRRRQWVFIP